METSVDSAPASWMRGVNLETTSFGWRTNRLEVRRIELPSLDWTVFVAAPPIGTAFHLFRIYFAFDSSLRSIFYTSRNGTPDSLRRRRFEKVLGELRVPRQSDVAYYAFGIYPRLWGNRFYPDATNPLVPQRLFSVAVPSGAGDACEAHLLSQVAEFGELCCIEVSEESPLIVAGDINASFERTLLLGIVRSMDPATRASVLDNLRRLVTNPFELDRFQRSLDPALQVGGSIRTPDARDIDPEDEETCIAIATLRVDLASRLNWPHALERMGSELAAKRADDFHARIAARITAHLTSYRSIREDPLLKR